MKRIFAFAVAALMLAACSSSEPTATPSSTGSSPATGSGATITATEKDFAIALDQTSVAAGKLTINITNTGPSKHELVIFKTELAEAALPLSSDGSEVNEDDPQLKNITEKEDIGPSTNATLEATLEAGKYVLICNLPTHYKSGMHVALTVS